MKKTYLFIISILVLVFLSVVSYKFFKHKNIIPLTDIKMVQGVLLNADKESVKIKFTVPEFLNGQELEKDQEVEYYIDRSSILYEQTSEMKSEEEFRREEQEYFSWEKLSIEEKSKKGFKLPADWRKNKKISSADLKAGDSLTLLYLNKDSKNFILMLIKNENNPEDFVPIDQGREARFVAEVLELNGDKLKIKINENLSSKISAGTEYDIDLSQVTGFETSRAKSEEEFRKEELAYQEAKQKIRAESGDISFLVVPSRYKDEKILREDFQVQISELVRVFAYISADGVISPSKIQKIIK